MADIITKKLEKKIEENAAIHYSLMEAKESSIRTLENKVKLLERKITEQNQAIADAL